MRKQRNKKKTNIKTINQLGTPSHIQTKYGVYIFTFNNRSCQI